MIVDTNAERGLGAVCIASVVAFGAWLFGMEARTAEMAKHLAEMDKGSKALQGIARHQKEASETV